MQRQNSLSKPILTVVGIALLAAGIAWFVFKPGQSQKPSPDANTSASAEQPAATAPAEQASADDAELRPQSAAERAKLSQAPVVIQPISRPAVAPTVARTEPSPYTRQLVAGLTNLDFSRGPITKEQAEQWKQGLQALTAQGAAAVPAIREFLEQNQELIFAGGNQLGQSSLRSAMI